ncbi:MAG: hypothetical protein Fur0034_11400 [Desulfuromonadia bacterium]
MIRLFMTVLLLAGCTTLLHAEDRQTEAFPVSQESRACIACHELYTPGIVADWRKSLHSRTTPSRALRQEAITRRISAEKVSEDLSHVVVGCYECHSLRPDYHRDNFRHNGYRINVIVSPNDCKICHPTEVDQYAGSKKAHAMGNLMNNPIYHGLVRSITGVKTLGDNGKVIAKEPSPATLTDTCLGCHGATIKVKGMKTVQTRVGEMTVPDLSPWPNQGVGRVNPDGSIGTCTACHTRHAFSLELARKPATCGQCHLDPDVPAYNVYNASKHGNLYYSVGSRWEFSAVPWTLGKDFTAPTCATCHNSLVVSPRGEVIAERTHDFGARLWVRLFGLPYSHPQPIRGDTTIIRNSDGLPLPTNLSGEPAREFLISKDEQVRRKGVMEAICNGCHSTAWVTGHFDRLDSTIRETDAMTLVATQILGAAWKAGVADKTNPFDEEIEKQWQRQWLFYGNSARYASAMTGAFDYAAFKNGWWEMSENVEKMMERLEVLKMLHGVVKHEQEENH